MNYDVEWLRTNRHLYDEDYLGTNLTLRRPEVLSGITEGHTGGMQMKADPSNIFTGQIPDVSAITAMDCIDLITYYLFNYLPNVEGKDVSKLVDIVEAADPMYRVDKSSMWLWPVIRNTLDAQGWASVTAIPWETAQKEISDDDYQSIWTSVQIGDIIQMGTSSNQLIHYAIYLGRVNTGSVDSCPIVAAAGSTEGPAIVPIHYYRSAGDKTSYPLYIYHMEFPNNYGTITVNKKDTNGNPLPGATFTIENTVTHETEDATTGTDGTAVFDQLPYGSYTITETGFPDGYTAYGETSWTCTLSGASEATKSFTVNAVNQKLPGTIHGNKATNTGANRDGWVFDLYKGTYPSGTYVTSATTDSGGNFDFPGLQEGDYYVVEAANAGKTGWRRDSTVVSVHVTSGATVNAYQSGQSYTAYNVQLGNIHGNKATNTGSNRNGWVFELYKGTYPSGTYISSATSDINGDFRFVGLVPGSYYVKEAANSDKTGWTKDTSAVPVIVTSGTTVNAYQPGTGYTAYNVHLGTLKIQKTSADGSIPNGTSFTFNIAGPDGYSNTVSVKVGETAAISNLRPGSYTVTETVPSGYVCNSANPQTVTVTGGGESTVSFDNTAVGALKIQKTSADGSIPNGTSFTFTITGPGGYTNTLSVKVGETVTVSDLTPGSYTVTEAVPVGYVCNSTNPQTVTVTGGGESTAAFDNSALGVLIIRKTCADGSIPAGTAFSFTVTGPGGYSSAVSVGVGSSITLSGLVPGSYTVTEAVPAGYICNSTNPQTVTVVAGGVSAAAEVAFDNTQYGKIQIQKDAPADVSLAGWVFRVFDSANTEIPGSPFVTDAAGRILIENLLPGTYSVEEVLAGDSIFAVSTENPATTTVTAGNTATVSVTNVYRTGKIVVHKTTSDGTAMENVRFRLDWSEDGVTWNPVTLVSSGTVVKGGCSAASLDSGCLTTDGDGKTVFTGLFPSLKYRIVEEETVDGKTLLAQPVSVDLLPGDGFEADITVVNHDPLVLPFTGSYLSTEVMVCVGVIGFCLGLTAVCFTFKKSKNTEGRS